MRQDTALLSWEESLDAAKIVTSAQEAIKSILQMGPNVLEEHKKSLISRMLWKITEAHGKYNTRYYSKEALKVGKNERRHDHVLTRAKMIKRLLNNADNLLAEVDQAIGCIVTRDEHDRLSKFDTDYDGWERYRKANIKIWDRKEKKFFDDIPDGMVA